MDDEYSIDDVVWAKIKGFPWWPGVVSTTTRKIWIDFGELKKKKFEKNENFNNDFFQGRNSPKGQRRE